MLTAGHLFFLSTAFLLATAGRPDAGDSVAPTAVAFDIGELNACIELAVAEGADWPVEPLAFIDFQKTHRRSVSVPAMPDD